MVRAGTLTPHVAQPLRGRKIAIIGAGISGIATAKCLLDEGLDPVVFEQAAQSGVLWGEVGTGSLLYPSLRTNTSKYTFAFSGMPFPNTAPAETKAAIRRQRAHPLSQNPVPMWVQIPQYTDAIARILGVYPHARRHLDRARKFLLGPMSADDYRLEQRAIQSAHAGDGTVTTWDSGRMWGRGTHWPVAVRGRAWDEDAEETKWWSCVAKSSARREGLMNGVRSHSARPTGGRGRELRASPDRMTTRFQLYSPCGGLR